MPLKPSPIKKTTWWLREISYRIALPVMKTSFHSGGCYPICPRCNTGLDREYVSFCDRCGQRLAWNYLHFTD